MNDPLIGTWLDDRYEILSVVGVGGMSVVYRAKCHRLNRMVAVKVLKPELAQDQEIRKRFHDESQAVAMMSHPNIVNVYDVNQSEGLEYIVMELIEGITLKQYMKKRGEALNWREALHFGVQIFQALKHAHSRGIVHRDIKPQNIMVLRDGSVKVADFGIARIANAQRTMTAETLGSVHYISPEQAKGSDVDGRSDLYSAGVVLYEMLTGRLPFEGDSAIAVALQHINSVPLAPREIKEDIPVGMEQITMRCMAPKRELRYSNADEVLADLETFRKAPDTVFPYENPWIPGDDSDATVIWNQPVAADEADRDVKVVPSGGEVTPKGEEPPKPQQEEPTKAGKTKRRVIMGVTIAVLLVIIALLLVQVWNNVMAPIFTETATYRVPELEGKTVVEAEQYILENEEYTGHFTITVSETTVYDVDYEPGQIISQTPKGGTTTKSDSTEIVVTLCGDGTTEESIMPSIIGGDYKEWAKLLEEDYDVVVKYDGRNSDDFEEGKIILTEPVAGTKLSSGQSVMLYYSKGPAVKPVTMIPLEGLTLEQAKSKLEELGLELGEPVTVESDMAKGTVVYQSVPTGTEVTPGTKVNLHISAGPAEVEDPVEPPSEPVQDPTPQEPEDPNPGVQEPDPSNSTQYYKLRITLPSGRTSDSYVVVTVPGNSSPLYQGTLEPDETALNLTLSGNVEGLSVTVDGEPYDNYILEQVDALE